jgi:hypothetical protein
VYVMIASIVVVVVSGGILRRKLAFWTSLIISSAIHLVVVHTWTGRVANLSRGQGKLATCLGCVLFLLVYGFARLMQRTLYSEQVPHKNYKGGEVP